MVIFQKILENNFRTQNVLFSNAYSRKNILVNNSYATTRGHFSRSRK